MDTFCKIERFRHRRHICSYVKKREKNASSLISASLLFPLSFLFLSSSFLYFSFIFFLFPYTLSCSKNVNGERERERGDTVRDIVRLLYRGNDSRREERYSKDRRSEGTRFRPRAGMIDRTRFRSFPLGAILMQNAPILVDESLRYFREDVSWDEHMVITGISIRLRCVFFFFFFELLIYVIVKKFIIRWKFRSFFSSIEKNNRKAVWYIYIFVYVLPTVCTIIVFMSSIEKYISMIGTLN